MFFPFFSFGNHLSLFRNRGDTVLLPIAEPPLVRPSVLLLLLFCFVSCCFGPCPPCLSCERAKAVLRSLTVCPSPCWSRWASKRWRAIPHWGTEGDRLSSPPASHRRQRPSQGLRRSSLPVCLLLPDPGQLLFLCLSFLRRDLPKDKRLQGQTHTHTFLSLFFYLLFLCMVSQLTHVSLQIQ